MKSKRLSSLTPTAFVRSMTEAGTARVFLVWDRKAGRVSPSHTFVDSIAASFEADPVDYEAHEGVFLEVGAQSGALLGAFVHNTVRGQAAGGVRLHQYDSVGAFLTDGLRLSKGMTHKNALAGLWWGGGKGVIAQPRGFDPTDSAQRTAIFQDYGRMMSGLMGCYVTAEDAGTTTDDMAHVFRTTRFTTCTPESLGGSGNPSIPTARGVVCGMEAALEHLGLGALAGKSVAIQGLGNVGRHLVTLLAAAGVRRIVAADVVEHSIEAPGLDKRVVAPDDPTVLFEDVDILAPCAVGGTLNEATIPKIRAKVICGAANNQLAVPEADAARLHQRGIAYVPDFLVNRMGIVNCANEQYGYVLEDDAFERHLGRDWSESIHARTKEVLTRSSETQAPTHNVAIRLAQSLATQPHPIWGHRGQAIIDGLLAGGWASG